MPSYYYNPNYLQHFGIPHMHWGERRFQRIDGTLTPEGKERYNQGDSSDSNKTKTSIYVKADGTKDLKRIDRDAKKDAEEYARAKAYYGEGAGTRRKKIKNQISERMKDPDYKNKFDEYLSQQDMSEHQKAANRERKVQDTKNSVAKTARGVKNFILGAGTTSLAAIALVKVARQTGADQKIKVWANQAVTKVTNKFHKPSVNDYRWH